jgi:SAM-dependent methyltransferase
MLLTLGRAPAMREEAADLAAIQSGESVLEVGCGTGALTRRARLRAGSTAVVCGIDPSPEMIEVARRKAARAGLRIDYRVAAIEALPFADASFHVVLSSLMMHHLPDDLKALGLAEVRRVLKPGGRLLIVDMKRPSGRLSRLALPLMVHSEMNHGVQDLSPVIEAAGFSDVKVAIRASGTSASWLPACPPEPFAGQSWGGAGGVTPGSRRPRRTGPGRRGSRPTPAARLADESRHRAPRVPS